MADHATQPKQLSALEQDYPKDEQGLVVLPEFCNFLPPGTRSSAIIPDDGWPSWQTYKPYFPGPLKKAAEQQPGANQIPQPIIPEQPAEAKNPATDHYLCCEKHWEGPRQLRMHRLNNKTCPHNSRK